MYTYFKQYPWNPPGVRGGRGPPRRISMHSKHELLLVFFVQIFMFIYCYCCLFYLFVHELLLVSSLVLPWLLLLILSLASITTLLLSSLVWSSSLLLSLLLLVVVVVVVVIVARSVAAMLVDHRGTAHGHRYGQCSNWESIILEFESNQLLNKRGGLS